MTDEFRRRGVCMKNNVRNTKDKIEGKTIQTAGKLTGNEQLELKGNLLVAKVEIAKKMDMKNKATNIKEGVAKKINGILDKNKHESKN